MPEIGSSLGFWGLTLIAFALLAIMGWKLKLPLWLRVFAALIAGGAMGYLFREEGASIKPMGEAFVSLIRMLIVPLIFTTLTAGVIAMGDPKRLGSLGAKTLSLYIVTTVLAVSVGLAIGTFIEPGAGATYEPTPESIAEMKSRLARASDASGAWHDKLLAIIPENPVRAMSDTDVLSIIFFSIMFGVGILMAGEKAKPLSDVMEGAAEAVLKVTGIVMELAPFGVYALMAWVLADYGLGVLVNLGKLAVALYLACAIQILVVYTGIIRILLGLPVLRFFRGILDAIATAYSTSSSSATLPVTISNVSNNLGVERSVAGSVLPLGATINMDGTSIYLGLIALFAAQALNIDLSMADYVAIAATATLASIGAAGIPSASLFLAVTVLAVIDVPENAAILIIAFIFPFDRLLDMARTATNVTGDAAVATAVAKWEGALDEEVFRGTK